MNALYEKAIESGPLLDREFPEGGTESVAEGLAAAGLDDVTVSGGSVLCCVGRKGGRTLVVRESGDFGLTFAAAKLLKAMEGELDGQVKILISAHDAGLPPAGECFTPESTPAGDALLALLVHKCNHPGGEHVRMLYFEDGSFQMRQEFELRVRAVPGVKRTNPLNIGLRLNSALSSLVCSEFPSHELAQITVGSFDAGRVANAAAEVSVLRGVLSCCDANMLPELKRRFEEVSHGVVSAFRAECEIDYLRSFPPVRIDDGLARTFACACGSVLGSGSVKRAIGGGRGGVFALCSASMPTALLEFRSRNALRGDELLSGAAALAACAIEYFKGGCGK